MHTNHRRKKPRFTKRHGGGGWCSIYSMKPMKQQKSSDRRALERSLMERGFYDKLPVREHKDIIWEYW